MGLPSDFEWRTSYRHEDGELIELFYNPAIPFGTSAKNVRSKRYTGLQRPGVSRTPVRRAG